MKTFKTILITLIWALIVIFTPVFFKEFTSYYNLTSNESFPVVITLLFLDIGLFIASLFNWVDLFKDK